MPLDPPSRETVEEAIEAIKKLGSKTLAAKELGIPRTTLSSWLEIGDRLYEMPLPKVDLPTVKGRRYLPDVTDAVIYVAGDAHYWPGPASTAHRALVKFLKREKNLHSLVMNGDAYDLPGISRHDGDWFQIPTVQEELEVVDERLNELVKASGKARRFFTRGNHDIRYDRFLAKNAREMAGVPGMTIDDRLPLWEVCWSLWINDGPGGAVIKHRPPRGGIHSTTNSPLWSGRSTICNHLHSLQCRPLTDFNGTRFGVDCGTLCDIYAPQFSYLEDGPRSWVSGFVRVKWVSGRLLMPELIRVVEPDVVEFRGELIHV
jgi:hypothetical protein